MSRSASPSVDRTDEPFDISEEDSDFSEPWLDELCLEPLTSEPGFSRLCNACTRVFRVYPHNKRANHIQYLDTLGWSAQRGCVLCALIFYRIEGKNPSKYPSPQLNIRYEVGFPFAVKTELGVSVFGSGIWEKFLMLPLGNYLDSFSCKYTNVRSIRNTFLLLK